MKVVELDEKPVCRWCGAAVQSYLHMDSTVTWVHVEGYMATCRDVGGHYLYPVCVAEPLVWGYAMRGRRAQ